MSEEEILVDKIKTSTKSDKSIWSAIFNFFGFGGKTIEYLFKIVLSLLELFKIALVIGGIGAVVYVIYYGDFSIFQLP